MDCKPKVVITSNAVKRGPKAIHLKDIVDAALDECAKSGISVGVYFNVIAFLIRATRYLLSFMWSSLRKFTKQYTFLVKFFCL